MKIKYGEYYNKVSIRDFMVIRWKQLQILLRKFIRRIKQFISEWFNLTFIISAVSVCVYILLVFLVGNYYKGYGFRRTLWDNKNILFTFLLAPNLIRFTINVGKKQKCNSLRHELYTDVYLSFRDLISKFYEEAFDLVYKSEFLYTKEGISSEKNKIDLIQIPGDKFMELCKSLEEEIPIVEISKSLEKYFYKPKEINQLSKLADSFTYRNKLIFQRNMKSQNVIIDNVWDILEYYIEFVEIVGINEPYRNDTDIQKEIINICAKKEENLVWLKRQYDLACMSGIGYEIPESL